MRHLVVLATVGLLAHAAEAQAATDVIGNVNTDTHWTTAGSPYRLTGDVTVAPLATLTIDPGVIVEAAVTDGLGSGTDTGKVELVIRGGLVADGSAAEPIVFRAATAAAGAWYGVAFEPGARASSVTHAVIQDAAFGVWARTSSALQLADLTIERGETGLLWQATPGPTLTRVTVQTQTAAAVRVEDDGADGAVALLDACVIRDSFDVGLVVTARVAATVRRSHLVHNRVGIDLLADGSLTLVNSVIAGNRDTGARLTQSGTRPIHLLNNTIDRNVFDVRTPANPATSPGTGVWVTAVTSTANFIIRNNVVTSHGTAGIRVDGATVPSVDHNNVWGNATNYAGTTGGVGATSANPLYQAAIAPSGSWEFVDMPYAWSDSGPLDFTRDFEDGRGVVSRLRFGYTTTYGGATCYYYHDRIYVYDRAGALISTFCGTISSGTVSGTVAGSLVRLAYDSYYSDYGGSGSVQGIELQRAAYNYRLQPSSPVIDTGSDLDVPIEDADGATRPYDGNADGTATTDMGAYEWHENLPPYAVAGEDHTVLPSTVVSFSSAGSHDPDGAIVAYAWDFGDGTADATTPAATHGYAATGDYTVTLTVTDDQGATGTDTAIVRVVSNLPPNADAGPDQYVTPGAAVSLDAGGSTDADGTIVGYSWTYGDGSPPGSGKTVTHIYPAAGVYVATVTTTDNLGATDSDTAYVVVGDGGGGVNAPPVAEAGPNRVATAGVAVSLDGGASTDSDGTIVSYAWDFGDGATAAGVTASHAWDVAGSYLVKLTVTDDDGASAEDLTLVVVVEPSSTNLPPVAEAGPNRLATTGVTVSLDGGASTDSDGTIVSYAWDFGDGDTATGAGPSHAWDTAGSYLVKLTVTDDDGASDEDLLLVTVSDPTSDNAPPIAEAGPARAVAVDEVIVFDAGASVDADGTIVSYAWDFGDGDGATGATSAHAFAAAGTYFVRLTVTDDDEAVGEDYTLVTVGGGGAPNTPPVAAAGDDRASTAGLAVAFDGSGSTDLDGTLLVYLWDFGDGGSGVGRTASHVYAAAGSYAATLTVIDDDGATATDTLIVTVAPGAEGEGDGCGCRAGAGSGRSGASALLLGLALLACRRRPRRPRRPRR